MNFIEDQFIRNPLVLELRFDPQISDRRTLSGPTCGECRSGRERFVNVVDSTAVRSADDDFVTKSSRQLVHRTGSQSTRPLRRCGSAERLWVACALAIGLFFGTVIPAWADPAEDSYLLAAGYYKKERFDLATDQFLKFIKTFPGNPRIPTARFFLGLSQINTGDFKTARESLRLFLNEAPTSGNAAHAAYRVAECSYLLDDLARAEPELATFLTKYPGDPLGDRALPYLGDVQLRLNKIDKALQSFKSALDKYPAGPMVEDCEFGLAKCYENKQDLNAAISVYTKLAANQKSERAPEAQLNLGNRLYDLEKFTEAAAAFDKLELTYPNNPLVSVSHLNHGFCLFETDQFAKAAEHFAVAEKDPMQAVEAAFWRSQCAKSLGNHTLAIQILKPLVASAKDHKLGEKILYHLGDSELQTGQFSDALMMANEVISRYPKGELADDALLLAGQVAIESGNVAESEKVIAQFGKQFPQSALKPQVELLNGRLHLMKGQTAEAVPIFERVVKDATTETARNSARYYIGYAQLELGHPELAMVATGPLVQAVEKEPAASAFTGVYLLQAAGQLALANQEPIANTQRELYNGAMNSASLFLQKSATAKEVDQALAIRALAAAHAGLKDRAKADVETLGKNFATSPELAKTLYEVAEVAYANQDWEWSETLFTQLAAQGKTSKYFVPGVAGQAWTRHQRKQFPAAAMLFQQLATDYPEHKDAPEWAFMSGKALQSEQKEQDAIQTYRSVLMRYPMSRFGYLAGLEAARLLRNGMSYAEADKAYAAVLEKFPKPESLDKVLNEWALSNYEGKDYARSDAVFARLVKDTPDSDLADNARLSLAESDLIAGKLEPAKTQFLALSKDPKADALVQQTALFQLIVIHVEQQNWPEVRVAAEALTTRFPSSKFYWFGEFRLAEADFHQMHVPQAIERLKKVIAQKDQPDSMVSTEAWFNQVWILLTESYYREKNYELVSETVAQCRTWNPNFSAIYILDEIAGRALKAQAKFPEALATFQRITEDKEGRRTETATKAQFMIGEIYLLQKNFALAEQEFLKVDILYKFPDWQAPALFQAGSCQEELKHWKDASRSYEALLKSYPKSEYAKLAAERLPRVKQKLAGK